MGERPTPAPEGQVPPDRKDVPTGIEAELGIDLGNGLKRIDVKKREKDQGVVKQSLSWLRGMEGIPPTSPGLDEAVKGIRAPSFDEGPAALEPRVALGPADRTPLDIGPIAISADRGDVNLGDREGKPKEPAALAPAPKKAEKVDYAKIWPNEAERVLLTDTGGFMPGERVRVTGNSIALRAENGAVINRVGSTSQGVTLSDPLARFQVGDEVFTRVTSGKRGGYVAERFLQGLEQRRDTVAQLRSKLESPDDDKLFREVVVYQLDELFGKEPKTQKLRAQKGALYAKWDSAYQKIDRSGLAGGEREEAIRDAYRSLFGSNRDIFGERVQMEMKLSVGSNQPGKMLAVEGEAYEDAKFDAMLAQLGDEIGTYYGKGRMSAEQIREAFGIKGLPRSGQALWGEPGSRMFFSYADGKLYFYPPEGKTEKRRVNLTAQEVAQYEARTGKTADTVRARMVEQPMQVGGVKEPVDQALVRVREQRSKEYLASLNSPYGQS